MVSARGLEVLRVIVSDYILNREPVGSKSIVERHAFGVSAATIRNEMAQLEEAELITAPHTSSGRIPTDRGYRTYVDELADLRPLSEPQRRAVERFLSETHDFDDLLERAVRSLARLTQSVAVVQYPSLARASIHHVEFVKLADDRVLTVVITDSGRVEQRVGELTEPISDDLMQVLRNNFSGKLVGKTVADAAEELRDVTGVVAAKDAELIAPIVANLLEQVLANRQDRLVLAGTANLARTERDFPSSILPVLEAIEEQVSLLRLIGEMQLDESEVGLRIGHENVAERLFETSVLAADYSHDGGQARLGVIGPTRMDYQRNIAAVRAVAKYLSRASGDEPRHG